MNDFLPGQSKFVVLLTTAASQAEAERLATVLVEAKLAACVNLFPIHSVYVWQGEIQREPEWQLMIKTRLSLFEEVKAQLDNLHSYELPELIAIPIVDASAAYLNWVGEQVKSGGL